jgi:protoheme IX farnesyltransferase
VKSASETLSAGTSLDIRSRTADFFELTKPRITFLVVITTLVGFYLGAEQEIPVWLLIHTIAGTALVAAGASALNMYLERDLDALMRRTENRPLPGGRLSSSEALGFAVFISASGMLYLIAFVNLLTGVLSATTFLSYLFVYTPLKTRTWLSTLIGAVPGALPTVMGWSAVTGGVSYGALVLFGIVFLWQMPHFYAIGWMYREDYARAGFTMLPVLDEGGQRTGRQSNVSIALLIAVTLLPVYLGISGWFYLAAAVVLGIWFLGCGIRFSRTRDRQTAKRLFIASVCYLPLLLTFLIADKV